MHDIVIIISRIEDLKGTKEGGTLDTLRTNAIAANDWLLANPGHGKAPTVHEWLEGIQNELGSVQTCIAGCNGTYPF
jgi:hypothetical protein